MLIKCECCDRPYWECENQTFEDNLRCERFDPSIDRIKEYSTENDISVLETIELIKLCCR